MKYIFYILIFFLYSVEAQSKILLDADKMRFKKNVNEIEGVGNVEVVAQDKILRSDYLYYNKQDAVLEASGDVEVRQEGGYKILADKLWGKSDFSQYEGENIYAMLDGVNHLQGRSINYEKDKGYIIKNARFTACDICNALRPKTPLWSFNARRVFYDEKKENVYYKGAYLNVVGVPIAYFPYFSHPSPTVKKRTGFLMPVFEFGTNLGNKISVPIFVNLASNYDFTYTPTILSESAIHHDLSARAIGQKSNFAFEVGYIRESDKLRESLEQQGLTIEDRDNWLVRGRYEYQDFYGMQLEYNLKRTSSEVYLQRYAADFSPFEDSDLLLYKHNKQQSFFAEVDYGNDLRSSSSNYYRLPHLNYRKEHKFLKTKGVFTFDTDYLIKNNVDRRQRISFAEEIIRDFDLASKGKLRSKLLLRGDFYNPLKSTSSDVSSSRLSANYYLEYSNDYHRKTIIGDEVLTPKVKLSLIPKDYNKGDINQYDVTDSILSFANIYRDNLYTGYDYIDQDSRVTYGFDYQAMRNNYYHLTYFLGQIYRFSDNDNFALTSGLADNNSDYISSLDLKLFKNYRLVYNANVSRQQLSPYINDLTASAFSKKMTASLNYTNYNLSHIEEGREDTDFVSGSLSYQVTPKVKTRASALFDFENQDVHKTGLQRVFGEVAVKSSCASYSLGVAKTYIDNEYIDPDLNIQFKIVLHGIGQSLF